MTGRWTRLTNATRATLKVGDKVRFRDDSGSELWSVITEAPVFVPDDRVTVVWLQDVDHRVLLREVISVWPVFVPDDRVTVVWLQDVDHRVLLRDVISVWSET